MRATLASLIGFIFVRTVNGFGNGNLDQTMQIELLGQSMLSKGSGEAYNNATTPNYMVPDFYLHEPDVVLLPRSAEDVAAAVLYAKKNGYTVSPAAGRHGSAAWCFHGNIAIDLSQMDGVEFVKGNDGAGAIVKVQSGANLGMVIDKVQAEDHVAATGVCAGVGIAGWTLGGGYSPMSKLMGLGVDNVLEMEVVLANGSIVTTNANEHPDLFWALRGAGHQSFGIVTELTVRAMPLRLAHYKCIVGIADAAAVLNKWHELYYDNATWVDSPLSTYSVQFGHDVVPGSPLVMGIEITWPHSSQDVKERDEILAEFKATLQPLVEFIGDAMVRSIGPEYIPFKGITRFDDNFVSGIGLPSASDSALEAVQHLDEAKVGLYIKKRPDFNQIVAVVKELEKFNSDNDDIMGVYTVLEPYAGAATAVKPTDTAFYHRNVLGDLYVDLFATSSKAFKKAEKMLQSLYEEPEARLKGQLALYKGSPTAYQNYKFKRFGQNERRANALKKYYAGNACELARMKRAYDPDTFFDFPQGIPTTLEGC